MQRASEKAGNRNPEYEREWEQKQEPETEEKQFSLALPLSDLKVPFVSRRKEVITY